ncbi:MAG: hypothetical protein Q9Q40_11185 [Acidobacteriota bacterium]|nr:hypothetical protein [Acidobacteriota bacterium]
MDEVDEGPSDVTYRFFQSALGLRSFQCASREYSCRIPAGYNVGLLDSKIPEILAQKADVDNYLRALRDFDRDRRVSLKSPIMNLWVLVLHCQSPGGDVNLVWVCNAASVGVAEPATAVAKNRETVCTWIAEALSDQ